jgi:hypothetical protein
MHAWNLITQAYMPSADANKKILNKKRHIKNKNQYNIFIFYSL